MEFPLCFFLRPHPGPQTNQAQQSIAATGADRCPEAGLTDWILKSSEFSDLWQVHHFAGD
jgi:hypothetical protein